MRIVVFSRHFPEYCYRYAHALAHYADVLLILDTQNANLEFDPASMPVCPRLAVKYTDLHPKKNLLSLIKAVKEILAFDPDFMHFQDHADGVTPLIMTVMKPFTRVVFTVHDPKPHTGGDSSRPSYVFRLARYGRQIANLVVVHGDYCRNLLASESPALQAKSYVPITASSCHHQT